MIDYYAHGQCMKLMCRLCVLLHSTYPEEGMWKIYIVETNYYRMHRCGQ